MMTIPNKLYILSDVPKIKPITRHNFFSIDIRPFSTHHNALYSFECKEMLEYLKKPHDPYYITQIDTENLIAYCKYNKNKLIAVKRTFCSIDRKTTELELDYIIQNIQTRHPDYVVFADKSEVDADAELEPLR